MNLHYRRTALVLVSLVTLGWLVQSAEGADPRWRHGVGVAGQNIVCGTWDVRLAAIPGYRPGDEPYNPMGIGWHFNWGWTQGPATPGIDYMPLIGGWSRNTGPTQTQINNRVNDLPDGTVWLIGNEIIWDDQRSPLDFARDFHVMYGKIKAANPTWQVAFGAIITSVHYNRAGFVGSPWELFDAIWQAYRDEYDADMPVDVWRIHPYVWRMATVHEQLQDFENQLLATRAWMYENGQQGKPLIITEYGLLEQHDPQWMIQYLLGSHDVLESTGHLHGMPSDEGRLVQRWAWFVMNNHVWSCGGAVQWPHTCLYDAHDWSITPLGQAFRETALAHEWLSLR